MTVLAETFVFGLANSLHCAGMCGPLAICAGGRGGAVAYHAGRTAGYAAAGALAGAAGGAVGASLVERSAGWIAIALAVSLVVFAAGGFAHLGKLPGVTRWVSRGAARAAQLPPHARGAVLGALTPLLPCGLLYVIYAMALLAGSAVAGAVTMFGFALGSLPALLLAQINIGWIRARLSLQWRTNLQRIVLLGAAALLAWRGWVQLAGASCCGVA